MPRPENYSRPEDEDSGEFISDGDFIEETPEDEKGEDGTPEVNPERYAIGIAMDQATGLPRVTSMGRGLMAARMLQAARDAGVPVEEDPELVRSMFRPSDNKAIPARTYRLIAEILTFIYRLNEAWNDREKEEELKKMQDPEPENKETDRETEN